MNKGGLLAALLMSATLALVVVGTLWPVPSALAYAGGQHLLQYSATPEEAVKSLGEAIRARAWDKAYSSLANRAQFTETQFERDLTGYYPSLLTYATLDHFDVRPLHSSASDADPSDYAVLVHRRWDLRHQSRSSCDKKWRSMAGRVAV